MSDRPSNTDLREAIWQAIKGWDLERSHGEGYAGATGTDVQTILDAVEPVFQAREQQLLTEILGEAKKYEKWVGGNQATGRAITVRAVPVSVIERLQNKTNDGGRNGASE